MILCNRILNLLDTKRRREVVRTLASSRNLIAEGERTFHYVRDGYANLLCRVAILEREGATPQEQLDCGNTIAQLGQLAGTVSKYIDGAQISFRTHFHKTPENDAFTKRFLDCGAKLQKHADHWVTEMNQWAVEMKPDIDGLGSRILDLKTWRKMTGVEFEYFIINKLQKQGFVAQATKASGDEGVDIVAVWQGKPSEDGSIISNVSQGRKYLIQCKRYDAQNAIGQPMLREFYGSMKGMDATAEGIFITTSRFTESAVEYAARMGIHIIDGAALDKMLRHPNYDT